MLQFEFAGSVFYVSDLSFGEYRMDIIGHAHSKGTYELHFVSYGKGTLLTEREEYALQENIFYVTGPGQYHGQVYDRKQPMYEYSVLIELIRYEKNELTDLFLQQDFWLGTGNEDMRHLFEKIASASRSQHIGSTVEMQALFSLLLCECIKLYRPKMQRRRGAINTSRTKELEGQFIYHCDSITLESLSKTLGLCERQTERMLKENFGKTFSKMKKEYQIEKAIGLFATDASLSEIALQCGFYDSSAFYKAFKQVKGETPSEYRKRKKKEL